jgi:hypothetical protein
MQSKATAKATAGPSTARSQKTRTASLRMTIPDQGLRERKDNSKKQNAGVLRSAQNDKQKSRQKQEQSQRRNAGGLSTA